MTTGRYLPRSTLFAAGAAISLGLAAAGCSGGNGDSADARGGEKATRAEAETTTPGAESSVGRLATAEFRVDGMTCGGCALATEMAVKKLDGVESADASYDEATGEGRCTVEYDPSVVTTDRIAAAIEKAGFTPTLEEADQEEGV